MKHVAILTGGQSTEREIALQSAQTIQQELSSFFQINVFDFPAELDNFLVQYKQFDCVVPVFHGKGGEDGVIQGFLETLGLPYIFSGVTAHALGLDKALTKSVVARAGFLVANSVLVQVDDPVTFSGPCVVKPNDGGSSVGISLAHNQEELDQALTQAFKSANQVLVEDYISGHEFTVAVIDENGQPQALPVIEIKSKNDFFDYQSKYDPNFVEEVCPADIDDDLTVRLQQAGLLAHQAIGAKDLTRSDFIVDKTGKIWFLEINTIPGATLNSLVPQAIRASGRRFGEVLAGWINQAIQKQA